MTSIKALSILEDHWQSKSKEGLPGRLASSTEESATTTRRWRRKKRKQQEKRNEKTPVKSAEPTDPTAADCEGGAEGGRRWPDTPDS